MKGYLYLGATILLPAIDCECTGKHLHLLLFLPPSSTTSIYSFLSSFISETIYFHFSIPFLEFQRRPLLDLSTTMPFVDEAWTTYTVEDMAEMYATSKPTSAKAEPAPISHDEDLPWAETCATPVFSAPVAKMYASQPDTPFDPAKQITHFTPFRTSTSNWRHFSFFPEPASPIGEDHYGDWYALSDAEDQVHPFVRAEKARRIQFGNNLDPSLSAQRQNRPENRFHPYLKANAYQRYHGPPLVERLQRGPRRKASSMRKAPIDDIEDHMEKVVQEKTNKSILRRDSASKGGWQRKRGSNRPTLSEPENPKKQVRFLLEKVVPSSLEEGFQQVALSSPSKRKKMATAAESGSGLQASQVELADDAPKMVLATERRVLRPRVERCYT